MAQPLIKFFRVAKITDLQATQKVQGGLYFETETGILYVYNGSAFEAYSGLKSASFADQKLVLTPSVGAAVEIDLSGYVDSNEFNAELAKYAKKDQTIAGIDLQDNITAEELKTALGLTTAQENVLEGVKVNGTALAVDKTDKTVDILVVEGATNGTIAVNGADVTVHGLGSAAYTDSSAYDAAGAAETVKTDLVNGETEFADFKAVGTELRALDADKVADVTVGGISVVNADSKIAALGTAAGKSEDYFVKSEGYVAYTQAEKDKLATVAEGAEVNTIEEVRVNGVALTVSTDGKRAVNVEIPDATVKSVKAGDKVLKLEGTELSTELSLVYETQGEGDAAKKYIVLKGINNEEIAKIDASDFIADSFLNNVELDDQDNLQFTWEMANGSTKTDTVNIAKYIDTYTAGNGIDITDKKVSVKRDAASESFLIVGADGVKLSGVQDAIDIAKRAAIAEIAPAIEALDAEVTSTDGAKVSVKVTEVDGKITAVNVTETDIASAERLTEVERVTSTALNDLNGRLAKAEETLQEGVGVMEVTDGTTNGTIVVDGNTITVAELTDSLEENSDKALTSGGAFAMNTALNNLIQTNTTEINALKQTVEGIDTGVQSVTSSDTAISGGSSEFIAVQTSGEEDVIISSQVKLATVVAPEGADVPAATGLATDAYVQAALMWQLF